MGGGAALLRDAILAQYSPRSTEYAHLWQWWRQEEEEEEEEKEKGKGSSQLVSLWLKICGDDCMKLTGLDLDCERMLDGMD